MEQHEIQIRYLIEKIIFLLNNNGAKDWGAVFEEILHKFFKSDRRLIIQEIIDLYKGGMGSFADLVLHREKKMLIEENDELEKLRHEIFNACLNY